MQNSFFMPVKCAWGQNAVLENSNLLSRLGKRCLIVTGKSGAIKSGALADAEKALKAENIEYKIFDKLGENPLASVCREE